MTFDASGAVSFSCVTNVFNALVAKNGAAAVPYFTVVNRKTFR